MKTYEKVIEALKDGEQSPEEIAVNAMLPASHVSSTLRLLHNRGMVDWQEDQGRRIYRLTGVGI